VVILPNRALGMRFFDLTFFDFVSRFCSSRLPGTSPSLPFPSLSANTYPSLNSTRYTPSLLLCVAKRCPPTYHDEHHRRLFSECRLADAGARRCWQSGPLDDRHFCASVYVLLNITFELYFCRIGCHYHFIQRPTPEQQSEKFYHSSRASPTTFVLDCL
jgi:hypothetical protein